MRDIRYSVKNQQFTGELAWVDFGAMEWKMVRSAFIRLRAGRNQNQIADASGLRQGDISKLESNDTRGPTVATFMKAVELGLGMRLSDFFRQIEEKNKVTEKASAERDTTAPSIPEAIEHATAVRATDADLVSVIRRFEQATAILDAERKRAAKRLRQAGVRARGPKSVRRNPRD
jgi:transcriptional regulator with XRE-family HTH domain